MENLDYASGMANNIAGKISDAIKNNERENKDPVRHPIVIELSSDELGIMDGVGAGIPDMEDE